MKTNFTTAGVITADTNYENWYDGSEAAKLIAIKGIGRTKLYEFLRKEKIVTMSNEPYQRFIDQGYLKYVIKEITNRRGEIKFYQTVTLFSLKGIEYIKQQLLNKQHEEN